ncbi:NAD(P)/FAD-dependent oxidoreductase [Ketobacter alkanivorans]|uniref:FAD-dependent oxidoreductase n=1 Tax=Ketobacter alkanivorans TaxID=1917421 RepID=A0A2K9LKS4_9GAMM|nr:NAD(P)/FAD-dependent oxidoreductase [Ketobacter alkanivorans]AUM12095.1 FAD-dependent oxidoreductase [Ketobacter alkanivorans]MCP5019178.1 NAD(P)/FAD-dependent oxidoreductase [Ketobacter sp.]
MNTHRIVIVGGGAGGLELATLLGNKAGKRGSADITLVDANMTHLWKPRLHEVAAGVLNADVDELNYVAHAQRHHFKFIMGRMSGLDREQKHLILEPHVEGDEQILPQRALPYDTLVIAIGSNTNDFGTTGAAEHCIFLDKRAAAEAFHRKFLNEYLKASQDPSAEPKHCNIAIVGAGATGVELAAELNHSAHELVEYGFDQIKPENLTITIIEAANRVLPVLSEKASAAILRQLKELNIEVLTNEMVTEITADGLHTKSGKFVPAFLKVWSAGIKAPEFLNGIAGLESNRINQLVVRDTLQTTQDENIFAFGDCAQCPRQDAETPVPPRAQSAHQQALLLSKSLQRRMAGKPLLKFVYQDKGSLISLSRNGSVGNIMGNLSKDFTFEGKLARVMYITLYRMHQFTLHGVFRTLLLIVRDRINRRASPTLKLH